MTSGFKNFVLSAAAAEADRRGILESWYSGFYPKKILKASLSRLNLAEYKKAKKFIGRSVSIDESRVRTAFMAELVGDISLAMKGIPLARTLAPELACSAMRMFADRVGRGVRSKSGKLDIFHYRAGFGLSSLEEARKRGALLLCDHSIAHPLVLGDLIRSKGILSEVTLRTQLRHQELLIQRDIDSADHVLVNSEFVRRTFMHVGFDLEKVSVIYQGIDNAFYDAIPARARRSNERSVRFLFAGHFGERKGARFLLDATRLLPKVGWSLSIAGSIEPKFAAELSLTQSKMPISYLGSLDRTALARAMAEADVFIFPSLAEGSARVIFEAMASGCYIITTPNSGAIVEHGKHGTLVRPGDCVDLADAMCAVLNNREVLSIGKTNAELVAHSHRQSHYGIELVALYEKLLKKIR